MAIGYNYRLSPFPYFVWDAQNIGFYQSSSVANNLLRGGEMSVAGVTITDTPPGKTYTFNNPTNGFSATNHIRYTPGNTDYTLLLTEERSAFVTFKNTSDLDPAAPSHYRQTPFSHGTDGMKGGWNFERFRGNTSFVFRYNFDQDGTYGQTASFGLVNYDEVCQLGFVMGSGFIKLYKNGVYITQVNISAKTLATPGSGGLGIGGSASTSSTIYGFIGEIYNAAFWQTALTESHITQFYNSVVGRYQ